MIKLAVPTRGNIVDDHFGHCEMYTIFTTDENNKIIKTEILPSPQGCGCKSNIAYDLKEIGVSVMLAGNMGGGALNVLNNQGIKVVRGCSGDVTKVAEDYLKGQISDSGEGCHHRDHAGEGHVCNH
ncbi:MAG TPA: dinitrogenase iron-molybdenum cofactor biosynthesis protein [Bacteroidales bacterium]|nr:dinitrogenase iron-molybdenum cofactor biosynthesis protein [Bacteroidales bacterium]